MTATAAAWAAVAVALLLVAGGAVKWANRVTGALERLTAIAEYHDRQINANREAIRGLEHADRRGPLP